jgi:flagellar biogenesis protein FliO
MVTRPDACLSRYETYTCCLPFLVITFFTLYGFVVCRMMMSKINNPKQILKVAEAVF